MIINREIRIINPAALKGKKIASNIATIAGKNKIADNIKTASDFGFHM